MEIDEVATHGQPTIARLMVSGTCPIDVTEVTS